LNYRMQSAGCNPLNPRIRCHICSALLPNYFLIFINMKTYRHLYPQVYDWDNLYLAYRKARKGKRNHPPAAAFEYDQEANLLELQQELAEKSYTPGPYHSFYIHEPKYRLISAAPFRDRLRRVTA
jgi:hypothetical protein